MDPLVALRDTIKSHQTPAIDGDYFAFGDYRFHKTVPTALLNSSTRQPYNLESLNFVVTNADTPHTKYLLACSKAKIGMITLADKKDVIAYLKGEVETCSIVAADSPHIDPALVIHVQATIEERGLKRQRVDALEDLELDDKLLQEKQEIASRLDAPKVKTIVNEDMALLGSMTKDQIEAIKIKRLRTKMANITTSIPKKPERSSGFVEADAAVTRRIVDRERLLSTRTSVLNTNNKKHFTDIINAVQRAMKDTTKAQQQQPQQKQTAYDRYNVQEDKNWWKDKLKANDLDDFQIDTRGTFADGGLALSAPTSNTKHATSAIAPTHSAKIASGAQVVGNSSVHTSMPFRHGAPIIIIPSAITSLITMFNVKEFLEEGKYESTMEKKKREPSIKKQTRIEIVKKLGQNLPAGSHFHVVDSTTKMSSKDWSRVVAVYVLGQSWQFKDWHWPSPVELFSHVRGFYLKYDDDALPAEVKAWNVKILTISKSKRHLDQTAALQFWNALDEFLLRKH